MVRPATIRDEDLISAAREAFLEHGASATTADIAERAGVSEGILFHRFGSKAKLFQAAMGPPDWIPMLEALELEERVGRHTVEANLAHIVDGLIAAYRQLMPWMMMSYSARNEAGFHPHLRGKSPPPIIVLKAVAGYIEAETQLGRVRAVDAEIVARAIMGGAMSLVFGEVLATGVGAPLPLAKDMFVRGLVDLLMNGIGPARKKGR